MFTTYSEARNPGQEAVEHVKTEMLAELMAAPAKFPRSDLDAAQYIAGHCQTDDAWLSFRSTGRYGEWMAWDGTVHVTVQDELDYMLAKGFVEVLELVRQSIAALPNDDPVKVAIVKAKAAWSKSAGIASLRTLLRAELRVAQDHFDKNKRFIPMHDGRVLDAARLDAEPLAPDPRRPVTRKLGTTIYYEEGAEEPQPAYKWMHWLDTFVPNREEQRFLQQAAGAALLGAGDAKCIVHLVGKRHTGKTTYLNLMSMAFGQSDDNGFSGDLANGAIVAKYGGSTNFNQASAKGVRFLTLSEPSTQPTDDSFLKSISGSRDPIRTEKKGQNEERWFAECVLHIAANEVVRFNTRDSAVVARVNIIEFTHEVTPDVDNPNFEADLFAEESDGILAWIVEGAKMYEKHGIQIPESVRKRAEDNVIHSSSVLRWLEQRREEGRYAIDTTAPGSRMVEPKVGFADYMEWVREEGITQHAHKGQWLDEIQNHTGMPADRKGARPGGKSRVWGLVDPVALQLMDDSAAISTGGAQEAPKNAQSNTRQPFM